MPSTDMTYHAGSSLLQGNVVFKNMPSPYPDVLGSVDSVTTFVVPSGVQSQFTDLKKIDSHCLTRIMVRSPGSYLEETEACVSYDHKRAIWFDICADMGK